MKQAATDLPVLPQEVRFSILALLPPNDLALGARLSSKDAAERFSQPEHCTASIGQPLPRHVLILKKSSGEGSRRQCAEAGQQHALKSAGGLALPHKLQLLTTAAASGCEINVKFVLQLLQRSLFPELLKTDFYRKLPKMYPQTEQLCAGSAVVASGLSHLLPYLEQRCPGLVDPARTLEAAARHCDLAGLQAAWEVVGQRLPPGAQDVAQGAALQLQLQWIQRMPWQPGEDAPAHWRRILAAAAGSATPDALAKMDWVLRTGRAHSGTSMRSSAVWAAAAATGDLSRLRWLRDQGFQWSTAIAVAAVIEHADFAFIQRMSQEGLCPNPAFSLYTHMGYAAASSPRDGAAKLRWLHGHGVTCGRSGEFQGAAAAAAEAGNLETLQQVLQLWRERHGNHVAPPASALAAAVQSGHVPVATWLVSEGCEMGPDLFSAACRGAHVPMIRWLLDAGCPRGHVSVSSVVDSWPRYTLKDCRGLEEALQLLAEAGAVAPEDAASVLGSAALMRHPWAVWRALLQLLPPEKEGEDGSQRRCLSGKAVGYVVDAGCEATLEAMVGLGMVDVGREQQQQPQEQQQKEQQQKEQQQGGEVKEEEPAAATTWYATAAANGNRGMLGCLRRLGVPLGKGGVGVAVGAGAPVPALRWLVQQGAVVGAAGVRRALGMVARGYPREQERQGVEAWLRGLGKAGARDGGRVPGAGVRDEGRGGGRDGHQAPAAKAP